MARGEHGAGQADRAGGCVSMKVVPDTQVLGWRPRFRRIIPRGGPRDICRVKVRTIASRPARVEVLLCSARPRSIHDKSTTALPPALPEPEEAQWRAGAATLLVPPFRQAVIEAGGSPTTMLPPTNDDGSPVDATTASVCQTCVHGPALQMRFNTVHYGGPEGWIASTLILS